MTEEWRGARGLKGRPAGSGAPGDDQSLGGVAVTLAEEAAALVRAEFRLAKAEMKQRANRAAKGLVLLGAALVLGLGTVVIVLVALLAILEALGMPAWLAASMTAFIAAVGTAGLALEGARRLRAEELVPARFLAQLNKDRLAAKEQMK